MSKLTRRRALGLAGGLIGVSACATPGAETTTGEPQAAPAYAGEVAFEHGVASGDPLTDRVILWTRVTPKSGTGPIPVRYEVFADGAPDQPLATGLTDALPGRDFCVKVDAGDLKPDTVYRYRFVALTEAGEVASPLGRTKTAAAAGTSPELKLAVISCSNYPFGYFNVYREIAAQPDLDAVVHLGDYFYEYGIDGYGAESGRALGRMHVPPTETVTLEEYRIRHAQYKSDPDLQAAHGAAPWLCTWDDHESTNNSYRTGAQNHNPEENEGDWSERKQVAVQAYLEWMPVRDPEPGRAREAIYRKFDFGDTATIFCLESRLTGRSDEISWFAELGGLETSDIPDTAMNTMERVADPARTMLGAQQERWLGDGLAASTATGKAWQVLANQVIMADVRPPNFAETLTPEQMAAIDSPFIAQLVGFSQLGLPWNLDAWDGFPAARERLYRDVRAAGARLVTLTGDTHTAWANQLTDSEGQFVGVEFACTSVTSPGFGEYMPMVPDLGDQFEAANESVVHYDPFGRGFLLVTLTPEMAKADYVKVSTITEPDYTASVSKTLQSRWAEAGATPLESPTSSSSAG